MLSAVQVPVLQYLRTAKFSEPLARLYLKEYYGFDRASPVGDLTFAVGFLEYVYG